MYPISNRSAAGKPMYPNLKTLFAAEKEAERKEQARLAHLQFLGIPTTPSTTQSTQAETVSLLQRSLTQSQKDAAFAIRWMNSRLEYSSMKTDRLFGVYFLRMNTRRGY